MAIKNPAAEYFSDEPITLTKREITMHSIKTAFTHQMIGTVGGIAIGALLVVQIQAPKKK